MGTANMFKTMMVTAHDLLLNTVFFIMAVAVLAGAAIGLVPKFLKSGLIGANDIAVFTAMGMCWSGYLSTHIAMMDALDSREFTNKAIISHTIGGFAAGVSANFIYSLVTKLF